MVYIYIFVRSKHATDQTICRQNAGSLYSFTDQFDFPIEISKSEKLPTRHPHPLPTNNPNVTYAIRTADRKRLNSSIVYSHYENNNIILCNSYYTKMNHI